MIETGRFVFDTNVLVSALLLPGSVPGRAFQNGLKKGIILVSPATVAELYEVLSREKFLPYITSEDRDAFLDALVKEALLVEPLHRIDACADPKDNKFLEAAIEGNATCIISGDKHLLAMKTIGTIPILTPARFLST